MDISNPDSQTAVGRSLPSRQASRNITLQVGDKIDRWVVKELSVNHLKLGGGTFFGLCSLLAGSAALVMWIVRIMPLLQRGQFESAFIEADRLSMVLFALGLTGILFAIRESIAYSFDGNGRQISMSRLIQYRHWNASEFQSVTLAVEHFQSLEKLVLVLKGQNRKFDLNLGYIFTDSDPTKMIATAEHLSRILDLPLVRSGEMIQGENAAAAFDTTPAVATAGDGQDVFFNCPKCHVRHARAVIFDRTQSDETLDLLSHSVVRDRTTFILCLSYNRKTYSPAPLSMLRGKSPAELDLLLRSYLSLSSRVLAVVALALAWVPVFGPITALLAIASNAKHRTRWLALSIVALLGSSIWSAYLIVPIFRESAVTPPPIFRSPGVPLHPASENVK